MFHCCTWVQPVVPRFPRLNSNLMYGCKRGWNNKELRQERSKNLPKECRWPHRVYLLLTVWAAFSYKAHPQRSVFSHLLVAFVVHRHTLTHELSLTLRCSPFCPQLPAGVMCLWWLEVRLDASDTSFASELAVVDPCQVSVCFLHHWPQPALSLGFCRPVSLLTLKSLCVESSLAAVLTELTVCWLGPLLIMLRMLSLSASVQEFVPC